ncbi:hypothetical protein BDR03DRAFT_954521 [Suillus americanus]|nr:hypothetical protein BDR03DRAFT_954521 [Suillus americanus]
MSTVMHSSHHPQSHSADWECATPVQNKAMLQRQYRAKEAHALVQLQKILRDISRDADTHQTRLETIFQATEMIKSLYRRNTMLQELHKVPHLEPGHGTTAAFNYHLVQYPLVDWQWGNDHVDERHQYSAGVWSPPLTTIPTSLNSVAISGDRSFQH